VSISLTAFLQNECRTVNPIHSRWDSGIPWAGNEPSRKAAAYTGQHEARITADIHASIWIRTHDPCVSVGQ
jgi:hypothetical protein